MSVCPRGFAQTKENGMGVSQNINSEELACPDGCRGDGQEIWGKSLKKVDVRVLCYTPMMLGRY